MELFRDIGVKLVLQRVESDIASLQHVTLERTKSILCCGLHIGDVIKELCLLVVLKSKKSPLTPPSAGTMSSKEGGNCHMSLSYSLRRETKYSP
jgi:hypothetical protein